MNYYEFYSPKYARTEILKHQDKLKEITNLNDEEFLEVYELILKNVTVLNHSILPKKDFETAFRYCENIDMDDTIFVAFSEYLKSRLWTGDKKLVRGLEAKGFKRAIDTEELYMDFIKKSIQK
ncbi:MAG: PIN domain-containing protein [Aequorivita sp.]